MIVPTPTATPRLNLYSVDSYDLILDQILA